MMRRAILDKVATSVPMAHLDLTREHRYFMALTHAAEDPGYMRFFRERSQQGGYVILDNSTVELGQPEEITTYVAKAIQMEADEILLPDWLHEKDRTLREVDYGIHEALERGYQGEFMAVPQGRTQQEWLQCAREMLDYPIHTLGISRRYRPMFGTSRLFSVIALRNACMERNRPDVKIHLLGCAGQPETDVAPCLQLPYVQGVDSSLPCLFAKVNRLLEKGAERPLVSVDFFEDKYEVGVLKRNIEAWLALCSRHEVYVYSTAL